MTSNMNKIPTRPRVKRSVNLPKTRARFRPYLQSSERPDRARSAARCTQQDGGKEGYEKFLGSGCDYAPEQDDDFLPKLHSEVPIRSKKLNAKHENLSDDDANARSTWAESGSEQLRCSKFSTDLSPFAFLPCSPNQPTPIITPSKDTSSTSTKQDVDELAQSIHRLASGFETFTIAGTKNKTGCNTYLGTQGARKDKEHVSACQLSPSNIVITFKDAAISTSLRKPESSADIVATALYRRSLSSLYRSRGIDLKIQPGLALRDLANFNHFAKEIFPVVERTVTVHLYDIASNFPSNERQTLLTERREQLSKLLPRFDKCSALVLACDNFYVLKYSGIVDYFIDAPKRPDLELEIRIGIWSLPVQTPKARIAKDGISSIHIAKKSREELAAAGIYDDAGLAGSSGPENTIGGREMVRVHMLESLSKALGTGLVVPYGSRDGCFCTPMWKKEVWVWGREMIEVN